MKNLEKLSDKELMRVGQNGEKEVIYSIMYKKYFEPIKWFCLQQVRNRVLAEDLTQETFLKLYKSWETYKENSSASVKTWIYKIAKNKCIDHFRVENKKSDSKTKSFSEFFTEDYDSRSIERTIYKNKFVESPEKSLEKKEKNFHLMKIAEKELKKSRSPLYELMKLRYFDELSYEEIAEKLKKPKGTVKAQLFCARKILFDKLNKSKSIFYEK